MDLTTLKKKKILDKSDVIDGNFLTTSPEELIKQKKQKLFYSKP